MKTSVAGVREFGASASSEPDRDAKRRIGELERPGVPDAERGDCLSSACLARTILDHVFSRWGALVLWSLVAGRRRYSEIRGAVDGVSEKMLAQTLRTLERDGLIRRESYPVVPPHVEYELTALGERCVAHVRELVFFIEENVPEFLASHETYDRRARSPVGSVEPAAT